MVSNNTHCNVCLFLLSILYTCHVAKNLEVWLEHVSVIVGSLALKSANKTLKSHTCIDNLGRKTFEAAVSLAVELHEHEVPYLDDLWMILIYEITTSDACCLFLFLRTRVNMKFRTRTARTCVTHFPEVVVLVAIDDMILWQELFPDRSRLFITRETFLRRTFKDCCVEVLRVNLEHVNDILPSPRDCFLLEVIAKRPVAEHLEHGVVISVMSYLLKVVVLARYTKTLLSIGTAA